MDIKDELVQYTINVINRNIKRETCSKYYNPKNYKFIDISKENIYECIKKYCIDKDLKQCIRVKNNTYSYTKLEKVFNIKSQKFFEEDIVECSYYNDSTFIILRGKLFFETENLIVISGTIIPVNTIKDMKIIKEVSIDELHLSADQYEAVSKSQSKLRLRETISSIMFKAAGVLCAVDLLIMIIFLFSGISKCSKDSITVLFSSIAIMIIMLISSLYLYPWDNSKAFILNIDS